MAMEHIDRIFTRDLGDSASKARPEAWLTIERDHGHVERCEFWRPRAASIEAADDRLHDRIERPSDFDDEALCSSWIEGEDNVHHTNLRHLGRRCVRVSR